MTVSIRPRPFCRARLASSIRQGCDRALSDSAQLAQNDATGCSLPKVGPVRPAYSTCGLACVVRRTPHLRHQTSAALIWVSRPYIECSKGAQERSRAEDRAGSEGVRLVVPCGGQASPRQARTCNQAIQDQTSCCHKHRS